MPTKSIRKVKNPKNQMLRKILLLLAMSILVTLCLADELEDGRKRLCEGSVTIIIAVQCEAVRSEQFENGPFYMSLYNL